MQLSSWFKNFLVQICPFLVKVFSTILSFILYFIWASSSSKTSYLLLFAYMKDTDYYRIFNVTLTSWFSLLFIAFFNCFSWIFKAYHRILFNRDSFKYSFTRNLSLISFSSITILGSSLKTVLNSNGDSGHSCHFLCLGRMPHFPH